MATTLKGNPAPPASPDERFREEYRSNAATYRAMGFTEEAYVRTRRIDEGLEPGHAIPTILTPRGTKTKTPPDPADDRFRAEYRQHAKAFAERRITEEAYVRSRRVDEGLEPLHTINGFPV